MKKELNIAAILKDKPQNTRLWSPIFGDVYLKDVTDVNNNMIRITHHGVDNIFMNNGKVWADGDVCLFPSRWMNDWQKFAWKKGDVLSCGVDNLCIFKKWENDEYTEFDAEFVTPDYSGAILKTKDWVNVTNENTIKQYISKIEEVKGGKLNLETLEIEHTEPKQEFKDGDIITIEDTEYKAIIIYKSNGDCMFRSYAVIDNAYKKLGIDKIVNALGRCTRLATNSEKQQLFSALEKEGKRWNPDTKQIEDLPKKCELKPFDKVLARNSDAATWIATLFGFYDRVFEGYVCIGDVFEQCIPYNEETKHLLGTTDEWKGGE